MLVQLCLGVLKVRLAVAQDLLVVHVRARRNSSLRLRCRRRCAAWPGDFSSCGSTVTSERAEHVPLPDKGTHLLLPLIRLRLDLIKLRLQLGGFLLKFRLVHLASFGCRALHLVRKTARHREQLLILPLHLLDVLER